MKNKESIFDGYLLHTKIKSANVKGAEALIGYLIGPFCGMLANCLFGTYLVQYFREVLFAEELAAGNAAVNAFLTLFPILSAVLIVAGNLAAGQIIERTRTKAGKARPYILFSSVTLAAASVLMFVQPIENAVFKMVWLAVAYNLFYAVAFPLYNTANSALVPVSTRNRKQRNLLASFVNMALLGGSGAGSIVMPMVILAFANAFPSESSASNPSSAGYLILFVIIGVITFIGCILQYYFTRERVTEETSVRKTPEKTQGKTVVSGKKQAKAIFSDKFFIVTIIFYLLFQLSGGIKNGSMKSFTDYILYEGLEPSFAMSILGIVGAIPMAVAILFVAPLCNRFGKRPVVFVGMALGAAGGVIAGIFYDRFIPVAVGVALKCLGSAPAGYMILAMLADCLDHMEAKNGFRCDGLVMSIYSSVMIASVPLATGIINGILGAFGNQTGAVISYIWAETAAYALAAVAMLFFGVEKYLKEDRETVLGRQKAEAEAAGIEWIPPEERLRREEEEADRLAEASRLAELKARCERKGLSFEEEEAKYQSKKAGKKRKI